jgi:UDP-N-acetylmuramoyl-L-alanyl-D-glutamate--2,6-diaminopimelate ligase
MNFRKIVKAFIPRGLFAKVEPFGHLCEAVLFNLIYGFPARGCRVIGVTGTNGKTTTSFLIHKMLSEAGYKPGLMTTVAYGVGNDIQPQIAHMTTVSVPQLLKRIKQMKAQGVDWLILETTSHALAQNRVWGVPFSVAVLTNLTHEHLDYHSNFENYKQAKLKLFKMTDKNRKGMRLGVVNADDPSAGPFYANVANSITYGIDKGELKASKVKSTPSGVSYTATVADDKYQIKCQIPGSFNVYNSLAAVGVGRALGLNKKQIEQGIASLSSVEGRMARVDAGQVFEVIVDFAHTPDSFEKLFKDLRPNVSGKLIVLFGSAGRRDVAKRAVQGELAGKYADEVIVTEEDDRDEDGQEILNQIAGGAEKSGKKRDKDLFLIHDRKAAINFAISQAKSKTDVVLLLGKGHEKSIERANGEHPWNEIEAAKVAIKSLP